MNCCGLQSGSGLRWTKELSGSRFDRLSSDYPVHSTEKEEEKGICTNYAPVQHQLLRDVFGVVPPATEWKPETWPDYAAPIVRADGGDRRDCVLANFGLIPRARIPEGVRPFDTMNARSARNAASADRVVGSTDSPAPPAGKTKVA
ncbi:hypothetical protein GCM10027081_54420 [Cupriavidus yeoncheonensis]